MTSLVLSTLPTRSPRSQIPFRRYIPVKLVRWILQSPMSQSVTFARSSFEFVTKDDLRLLNSTFEFSSKTCVKLLRSILDSRLTSHSSKILLSILTFGPMTVARVKRLLSTRAASIFDPWISLRSIIEWRISLSLTTDRSTLLLSVPSLLSATLVNLDRSIRLSELRPSNLQELMWEYSMVGCDSQLSGTTTRSTICDRFAFGVDDMAGEM